MTEFSMSTEEFNHAVKNSWALVLKEKGKTRPYESRLGTIQMSTENAAKSLAGERVERYWYFDDQIVDSLVFALADAGTHTSLEDCKIILSQFKVPQAAVERVVLSSLKEYPDKFKVENFERGFKVSYKDWMGIEVERTGDPLDILMDIRLDMTEQIFFEL